jgi:flavoprotein
MTISDSEDLGALLSLEPVAKNFEHMVQIVDGCAAYPVCAQFNGITLIGCTECGMCDATTDITIILDNYEIRQRVVRQALLQIVSASRR